MTIENASIATEPTAGPATDPNVIEGAVIEVADEGAEAKAEGESPKAEDKPKAEKTPEQREIDRLRRGIDRRTRQLAEARAQIGLTQRPIVGDNRATEDDSAPLSLTRAELAEIVKAEAAKLAPTLRDQQTEVERRQGVMSSLETKWGAERFAELSSDLDDAFSGLADRSGKPKPATEAVLEADDPGRVIEWLADPDNADEAERISRLSAVQAGKAIAKLEARIVSEMPKTTRQVSKAPAPLEQIRGAGNTDSVAPDPTKDAKAWRRWRNEQERKGL